MRFLSILVISSVVIFAVSSIKAVRLEQYFWKNLNELPKNQISSSWIALDNSFDAIECAMVQGEGLDGHFYTCVVCAPNHWYCI